MAVRLYCCRTDWSPADALGLWSDQLGKAPFTRAANRFCMDLLVALAVYNHSLSVANHHWLQPHSLLLADGSNSYINERAYIVTT